jgi:hypothetical protein
MNFDDTAKFFGPSDKLWPDLFRPPDRRMTKLCKVEDCRREVKPRQRYCPRCARNRKRESNRRHIQRKRRLDVGKTENSPIGVEALTKAENQLGYTDSKTPILESSFPTRQETAGSVPT